MINYDELFLNFLSNDGGKINAVLLHIVYFFMTRFCSDGGGGDVVLLQVAVLSAVEQKWKDHFYSLRQIHFGGVQANRKIPEQKEKVLSKVINDCNLNYIN